jgi:cation:H+ antiporter
MAADGPEISSALYALLKNAHNVSVGVLVGSNAFNLAAMIGASALLAGSVRLPRPTLLLEGLFGLAITVLATAVLLGWLAAAVAFAIALCLLVPYLVLVIRGAGWLGLHASFMAPLAQALAQRPERTGPTVTSVNPTHHLLFLAVFDVALIIGGSVGMVEAALSLGGQWGVSHEAMAVLVLAPLTSLPNAITAIRLGLAGRSAALVGETFNSNTINLGIGVLFPTLFTTLAVVSDKGRLQLGWLIAMTVVCLVLLGRRGGLGRRGAVALIALYVGFVLLQLFAS